jgi:hypothetical protein
MLVLVLLWVFPLIANNIAENRNREASSETMRDYQLEEPALPEPPTYLENPPEWLIVGINLLLLAGLFGGIYALWRRLRPKSEAHAVVVTEVRRALTRLDAGGELKDVVIDCYARMVQGLEKRRRVKRHQAMTPREFEAYLADSGIASNHIHQLTELFELARYGARPANRETERKATQCLQAILEVYGE